MRCSREGRAQLSDSSRGLDIETMDERRPLCNNNIQQDEEDLAVEATFRQRASLQPRYLAPSQGLESRRAATVDSEHEENSYQRRPATAFTKSHALTNSLEFSSNEFISIEVS